MQHLATLEREFCLVSGEESEDPQHPKIVWPAAADCPNCRTDRRDLLSLDPQIAFVEGQLWNLTALVAHNIKVYGVENLVNDDGK